MASDLDKVKKLRELTGVGFKDCKIAIDENGGDIEKSIEFLRKKGIAKASKKMERVAADGLICISENENKFSIVEINSETDFVAKNNEFIKFVEEISDLALSNSGNKEKMLNSKMKNQIVVKDNLINLISKIGEKISIRRIDSFNESELLNFSYMHSAVKKNLGKIGVLLSLKSSKSKSELSELGKQLSMHIAALSPLSIDKSDLDKNILNKEKEIITEELKNSGKDSKIAEKIALGKLNKFVNVLKNAAGNDSIEVVRFVRYKVGEGV